MVVTAQYITRQDMCSHRKPYNKTCNETLWSAFLCIRLLVMVKYRQTCCATGCSISSNRLKINDTGPGRRLVKSQAFPRASFSENIERLITWFVLAWLGDHASPLVVRSVVLAAESDSDVLLAHLSHPTPPRTQISASGRDLWSAVWAESAWSSRGARG